MKQWVRTDEGWVNVEDVEFLGIEEGMFADEMTFEYKGKEYKSKIALGSRPG